MADAGANSPLGRGSQPPSTTLPYDTNALLSLYGMSAGLYGIPGGGGGGGGSPGASLLPTAPAPAGDTSSAAWLQMASQLAVQDYLTRVQAASRDPSQFAALQAQGLLPGYDLLTKGSKATRRKSNDARPSNKGSQNIFENLKLPSDTEIVKSVGSSVSSKNKIVDSKTSDQSPVSIPNIPPGLTIERKKPGRKPLDPNYHVTSSGPLVDKVEITKIPMSNGSSNHNNAAPLDMSKGSKSSSQDDGDAPLNLSMKSESDNSEPPALTIKRKSSMEQDLLSNFTSSAKIPSDYYASQALSGVFLAEQIRQQQLASELQNHLQNSNSSLTAMQALLSLGNSVNGDTKRKSDTSKDRSTSKNLGRGNMTTQPKKNTVASLLAQVRGDLKPGVPSLHPELTIEPIYKSSSGGSDNGSSNVDEFDQSTGGRRVSTYIDSEGRLQIKTVCESPEIRNLSERDSEEGHGSDTDQEHHEDGGGGKNKRYYATEADDLGAPLADGWRRETTIREYTKSGIRGEVVYVAPCGKRFKQYPDITRYLEKRNITNIKRENFSFSTKLIIGDFLRPSGETDDKGEEKYVRLSEDMMKDEIDKVRKENGWKPRKRMGHLNSKDSRKSNGSEKGESLKLEEQYKLLQRLQVEAIEREKKRRDEQEQIKLQKEAMRILKEAEKREKIETARREKEAKHQLFIEEKKRKQEEKQEEKLKKLHEIEMKRQQNAIMKEQLALDGVHHHASGAGGDIFYQAAMERERRRQHMMLMKHLDMKKRNDERKKNIEKMRIEKEKEKERRNETKRLELEILTEMKKPVEDMALPDSKQLPDLTRIDKLKLSGEAFANILMVFEFLHNFGETLGFDMESLPTMTSFQAALLNEDTETEEELLSIMSHLVVCAIEDPGVPMPLKTLTILGQNLRQADITNTNLSEILRIFIQARAMAEIKLFHGLLPPEPKDRKEAIQDLFINADEAYIKLLEENKTFQLSKHLKQKTFLCLNPTVKSEIVAFLCNELLSNKAVVNQIEVTMENTHVMKRKKLVLENKVKKLRILHNRKYKLKTEAGKLAEDSSTNISGCADSESHSEVGDDKEDSMSVMSESNCDTPTSKTKGKRKNRKGIRGKRKLEEEVEEENVEEEAEETDLSDIDDEKEEDEEDATLSAEDLQKKIERLTKLSRKKSEDFTFVNNTLRASDLGQDRFRRRYWHLAHAGGIFVEGLESSEPWKLSTRGLSELEFQQLNEVKEKDKNEETKLQSPPPKKMKLDDEGGIKLEGEDDDKENKSGEQLTSTPIVNNKPMTETEAALSKLGSDILVTPKAEVKHESKYLPKVTPNGNHLNMLNHSTYFNMTMSPLVLNGSSITITPKDSSQNFHPDKAERPWFNLVAREDTPSPPPNAGDVEKDTEFHPGRPRLTDSENNSQLVLMEKKLEIVKQMNKESSRLPIPLDKCYGWWKLTEEETLAELEAAALQKGTREQNLVLNVRKGFEAIVESSKKVNSEEIDILDEEEYQSELSQNIVEIVPGAPTPDDASFFSREVALRCEKYILEQVEALEDKVATASMQVPGWVMPDRPLVDTLVFRASCEEELKNDERLNTVEVVRERLTELEAAIERRYLKAPLGFSQELTLRKITEKKDDEEEEMEVEEEEPEEVNEDTTMENDNPDENGENQDEKGETSEEEKKKTRGLPRGLVSWREAVKNAKNVAQLAMAFYVLETSIAWDKSIMKASCQFCHGGENENALLLCDGCDKGYHTYCFKPPITKIPEGDWYCYECINKATGERHCLVCGGTEGANLINCTSCPRAYHMNCIQPALIKTPRGKWRCPGCNGKTPKKKFKRPSQIFNPVEEEDNPDASSGQLDSSLETDKDASVNNQDNVKNSGKKKGGRAAKIDKDISICQTLLSELSGHEDSWPFLTPVNTKQFPTYKKIIRIPMDISTIRKKLNDGIYKGKDEFKEDVSMIFQNCQIFNEDDSPVGKCGKNMKNFFHKRWTELTSN